MVQRRQSLHVSCASCNGSIAEAAAPADKAEKDADPRDSGESDSPKEAKTSGTTKMAKAKPEPAPAKAEPRGIRDLLDDPAAKTGPDKAAGPQAS